MLILQGSIEQIKDPIPFLTREIVLICDYKLKPGWKLQLSWGTYALAVDVDFPRILP